MRTRLEITTNRGLEDLVIEELRRLAVAAGLTDFAGEHRPHGLPGWAAVAAEGPPGALEALALGLRSALHVVRPIHAFTLEGDDPLGQIQAEVAALDIPELAPEGVRFRVTSRRTGQHPFTSEDVQRVAGAGVRDRAWRAVSLKDFDVELRVDVRDARCLVGVQLTREPLARRGERPYLPHMALQANVAWALLHLARPEPAGPPRELLDPFCGSGTILLEAAARWPTVHVAGGDTSEASVAGARANLAAAGHAGEIRVGDAREADRLWADRRFDTVVSNPPFGKRIGPNMSFTQLFGELLRALTAVTTPDARVALLVYKRGAFNQALREHPAFAVRHARVIELGGLHPAILVLDRVA
ncbi:MAG: methyltransferase domain-containing protein [Deltaproteobacteria bacterium]|nr:MAG: methyltransferase domain-containing protein [Deltaproteobacteria bacterium]